MSKAESGQAPVYTCAGCGARDFTVVHEYTLVTTCTITAACACGAADVAAEREVQDETYVRRWGSLDAEHHAQFDEREEEPGDTLEGDFEVFCPACFVEATEDDFDVEANEPGVEEGSDEFRVECAGCGRQIEFGWSHPDRGGRIWPVESSDFTPWKAWPEPRYREAWRHRGWLKPST
jgi:hypothetical protein